MSEQAIIDVFYYIFHDVFQAFSYYLIFSLMLTPKYNRFIQTGICTVINVTIFAISSFFPDFIHFCFLIMVFVVPALICYRDKKRYCLLAIVFLLVYVIGADMVLSVLLMEIWGCFPTQLTLKTIDSLVCALFCNAFLYITALPLVILWNKTVRKIHFTSMGLFILFPISQAFFLAACSYRTWTTDFFDILKNPFVIAAVVVSILSDIVVFRALSQNGKLSEARQRMSQMRHEAELQSQYYTSLSEKYAEIREYRHDINNLVATVETLLNSEVSRQDGETMLLELRKKSGHAEITVFCSNPILNAVLWHKALEAENVGIRFEANISCDEIAGIDKTDLCSVFTNAINYALCEAAGQVQPFVDVTCCMSMDTLNTEIRSSHGEIPASNKEKRRNVKEMADIQKCRLDVMRKIIEKYNGGFEVVDDGNAKTMSFSLHTVL